jgi:hypothetical protein
MPREIFRYLSLASQAEVRAWSSAVQSDVQNFGNALGAISAVALANEREATETAVRVPCHFEVSTAAAARNISDRLSRDGFALMPKTSQITAGIGFGGSASDVLRCRVEDVQTGAPRSGLADEFQQSPTAQPPPQRLVALSNALSTSTQLLRDPSIASSMSRSGPVRLLEADQFQQQHSMRKAQEAEAAAARQEAVLRVREMEIKEREALVHDRLRDVMERELAVQEKQRILEARAAADAADAQRQRIVSSRVQSMTIREQETQELERQVTIREINVREKEKQIQRVIGEIALREQALIDREKASELKAQQLQEQERLLQRQLSESSSHSQTKSSVDQGIEKYVLDLEYKLQQATLKLDELQKNTTAATSSSETSSTWGVSLGGSVNTYVDVAQRERDVQRREEAVEMRYRHQAQREALALSAEQRAAQLLHSSAAQARSSDSENDRRAAGLARQEKELMLQRLELDTKLARTSSGGGSVIESSSSNNSWQPYVAPHHQGRGADVAAMLQRVREREILLQRMSEEMQSPQLHRTPEANWQRK